METTKIQFNLITEVINTMIYELPFYARIKRNLVRITDDGIFEEFYESDNYKSIRIEKNMPYEGLIRELLRNTENLKDTELQILNKEEFFAERKKYLIDIIYVKYDLNEED